jgi:hypothetical protein
METKKIRIWDGSRIERGEFLLIQDKDFDYFELAIQESEDSVGETITAFKLQPSVVKNQEIFTWYIAGTISADLKCYPSGDCLNSEAGHLFANLQEFIEGFNVLNWMACERIYKHLSRVEFKNFYLYRTQWLLEQLYLFSKHVGMFFISSSPFLFADQESYNTWWEQPIVLLNNIQKLEADVDFNNLNKSEVLLPISLFKDGLIKIVGQWNGRRGIERFEIASGYFLALAHYCFACHDYSIAVLMTHRAVDCMLQLLAYRNGIVTPIRDGLKYADDDKIVSMINSYKKIAYGRVYIFRQSLDQFIRELNYTRNNLRETHGFFVPSRGKTILFLQKADELAKDFIVDIKTYPIKEKLVFNFDFSLNLIFQVESEISSYVSEVKIA